MIELRELRKGDRIRLNARYYKKGIFGKVIAVGPEQSEVRLDGERHDRVFLNADLVRVIERPKSRRVSA